MERPITFALSTYKLKNKKERLYKYTNLDFVVLPFSLFSVNFWSIWWELIRSFCRMERNNSSASKCGDHSKHFGYNSGDLFLEFLHFTPAI